jgi:hypothetical protein
VRPKQQNGGINNEEKVLSVLHIMTILSKQGYLLIYFHLQTVISRIRYYKGENYNTNSVKSNKIATVEKHIPCLIFASQLRKDFLIISENI